MKMLAWVRRNWTLPLSIFLISGLAYAATPSTPVGVNNIPLFTVSNPGFVTASITPSGTQDVNLTQVAGAAVALGQGLMAASLPVVISSNQSAVPVTVAAAPLQRLGITPTDKTITSATGSSQTLAAANSSRHGLIVQNIGNANCGVNPTGGTAAIGGAGTLTLSPFGSYQPSIPTLSAVTVICTAGQPLYAEEN